MDTPLPNRSGCDGTSDPPQTVEKKWNGFTIVRFALGALLLAAAGLKLADGGFWTAGNFGPFASPQLRMPLVAGESLLGVWLLLGLTSRVLWFVTLLFFSMLAGASLYLGIEGEQSCGCFGARLPVHPWFTAVSDTCAIAALLIWQPLSRSNTALYSRLQSTVKSIVWVIVSLGIIGGTAGVLGSVASTLSLDGAIIGDDKLVVLYPEDWVGKRLPLLPYIETGESLSAGEWLLLLVHSDCPKCREVLPRFEQLARMHHDTGISARVMVIDLPPYNVSNLPQIAYLETFCQRGRLTPKREWITKTPVLIKIVDGMVIEVDTAVRP